MPTLDEVGLRIAGRFERTPSFTLLPLAAQGAVQAGSLPGGSLEAWLSHLATPAPFLDESERLHNSAIARELTKLLVDDIERSEFDALASTMPYWLRRLVALWDRLGATVITFNYDTLLEHAVNSSELPWIYWPNVPSELLGAVAVRPLKMHGSTNWWWTPGDRSIFAVQPVPLAGGWGNPELLPQVPGMERFVAPPMATKSDFYDLSQSRQDWMSAREALETASRIVLMGYSAPVTDLTVASLLSNYADPKVPVVVVDRSPDEIVSRLQRIGLKSATAFHDSEPIAKFVEQYEQETSANVAGPLGRFFGEVNFSPGDPVVGRVTASRSSYEIPRFLVTEIKTIHGVTAVETSEWQSGQDAYEVALKAQQLRGAIDRTAKEHKRLVLRIPGEPDRAVLHLAHRTFSRNWLSVEA